MSELRIPPAVSFTFEKLISAICEMAKIDYDDRPYATRELLSQLESRWRKEIARG